MVIHAVLAIVNVPFVTAYFTKSVPRQIVDCGRRGIPRSNIRWPTGHSEGAATGGAHGRRWGMKPPRLYRRAGSCQRVVTCERAPYTSTPSGRSPEPLASTAFGRQPCFANSVAFVTLVEFVATLETSVSLPFAARISPGGFIPVSRRRPLSRDTAPHPACAPGRIRRTESVRLT